MAKVKASSSSKGNGSVSNGKGETASATSDYHVIPLSDIHVDKNWNARSDLGEAAGGPEETSGFDGLKASLMTKGQDTPVIVRPRYPHEKFREPYFLVAGYRRTAAIEAIAKDTKEPKPTVKAFIRVLSEPEARELNLRENTARENLSGPDLAFGVARMWESAERMGMPMTQQGISYALNLSQPYVGKMLAIASKVKGTYRDEGGKSVPILEHWRDSVAKATVEQMTRVAKIENPEEQSALYAQFVNKRANGKDARNPQAKLEQQCKTAEKWGKVLGILVHENAIDIQDDDSFWGIYLEKFMQLPNGEGEERVRAKIVSAAEKAFAKFAEEGEAEVEPHEETEEQEEEKPKKKKKMSSFATTHN